MILADMIIDVYAMESVVTARVLEGARLAERRRARGST